MEQLSEGVLPLLAQLQNQEKTREQSGKFLAVNGNIFFVFCFAYTKTVQSCEYLPHRFAARQISTTIDLHFNE